MSGLSIIYKLSERLHLAFRKVEDGTATQMDRKIILSYYTGPSYNDLFGKRRKGK